MTAQPTLFGGSVSSPAGASRPTRPAAPRHRPIDARGTSSPARPTRAGEAFIETPAQQAEREFETVVARLRTAAPRLLRDLNPITRELAAWLIAGARATSDANGVQLSYGGNWIWMSAGRVSQMLAPP